jgi:asparagine synthase (glutamine-hydrolysing)
MSFSMPLVRLMKEAYGDGFTLITGDGGDKVLRDIRPVRRMGNIDALVDYVLAANQLVPLDVVSAVTSIDKAEIIRGLRERFESYAERDMRLKYVHFIICERCMKWHFQGEDRNRFFLWPVTPFYSIEFFAQAMSCPFHFKSNYRIFGEMLISFSPEAAAIKNSKWDLPITSRRMPFYWAARKAYLYLPLPVRHFIRAHYFYRRRISAYAPNSNIMSCLFDQLDGCGAIADYLSIDAVKGNLQRIDKMAFDHLFTLTSTIEDFSGSRSSLEAYADRDMI